MLNDHCFLTKPVFGLDATAKSEFLTDRLRLLSLQHYKTCNSYKKLLDAMNFNVERISDYHNIPFLPVTLFKQYDLMSVEKGEIIKTMT